MTAPANVISFYAEAHWGSRYGVVDAFHPTPHKGLDCGLFHGNVDVPALHDGTVAAAAASSSVGHYVTVHRADGLFDTYCHIVLGVKVGQVVRQGDRLGRQAETQAEGGTAWKGQHTHLCLSRTRDGWAVWGYVNLDPTPGVIGVLTSTASSDAKPLDNATPPQEDNMGTATAYKINSGGLTGVSVVVSTDRSYVVPAAEVNPADQWAAPLLNVGSQGAVPVPVAQDHLEYLLHTLGFVDGDLVKLGTSGGGFIYPVQPGNGGPSTPVPADYFSDSDAANLQQAIRAAISAGNTNLLAAINQVDENTLATFGLKRA